MRKIIICITCLLMMGCLSLGKVRAQSSHESFYGVWVSASKSKKVALSELRKVKARGFKKARIYQTNDWSNLNVEHYYAISINRYPNKAQARRSLKKVKRYYPGAYVKFSGFNLIYHSPCPYSIMHLAF